MAWGKEKKKQSINFFNSYTGERCLWIVFSEGGAHGMITKKETNDRVMIDENHPYRNDDLGNIIKDYAEEIKKGDAMTIEVFGGPWRYVCSIKAQYNANLEITELPEPQCREMPN